MKRFFIIFLAIIVIMVAYYKLAYPTFTYKYRMTVEVETPEGIKSGSSVIEVRTKQWPEGLSGLSGGNVSASSMEGEAVFVDLDDSNNLVVILSTGINYKRSLVDFPSHIFCQAGYCAREGLDMMKKLATPNMVGKKAEVPKEWMPTMATFNNTNNPKSIEPIFATDGTDNFRKRKVIVDKFATKFGYGYKLNRMTLEITDDPITRNIIEQLPWLNDHDLEAIPLLGMNLYDRRHFRSVHSAF